MNAVFCIDAYKLAHADMYPPGTTKVYSNFTPRSMKHLNIPSGFNDGKLVWVGLQAFLKNFIEVWDKSFFGRDRQTVLDEFVEVVTPFAGGNQINTDRFAALHDLGYLPIEIKSLPEGVAVRPGIPVLTITNTHPDFFWLPNYLETWLIADLWKMPTAATIARAYRKIFNQYAEQTGANKDFVPFQGHDFSPRGMSGMADASITGIGHLIFSLGSDNIPAAVAARDLYNCNGG